MQSSRWQTACRTGVLLSSFNRIIHEDLHLICLKRRPVHELTEANKIARRGRYRQLQIRYSAVMVNFILFTENKWKDQRHITPRTTVCTSQLVSTRRTWHGRSSSSSHPAHILNISHGVCWSVGAREKQPPFRRSGSEDWRTLLPRSAADERSVAGDLQLFWILHFPAGRGTGPSSTGDRWFAEAKDAALHSAPTVAA